MEVADMNQQGESHGQFQARFWRVGHLAEKYGLSESELREALTKAGVAIFEDSGENGVTDGSWKQFLAGCIRGQLRGSDNSTKSIAPVAIDDGWGEERRQFFIRHPEVAQLVFVSEREPQATVTQNKWTATIKMPNTLEAGLKPDGEGFYLRIFRAGEEIKHHVKSAGEFDSAFAWLGALPPYAYNAA
jgi:hypothetical protein